jgi:hypothetical protein
MTSRKILGIDPKDAELRRSARRNSSNPFATAASASATVVVPETIPDADPDGLDEDPEDDDHDSDDDVSKGSPERDNSDQRKKSAVSDDTDSDEEPESPPKKGKFKRNSGKSVQNKALNITKTNQKDTKKKASTKGKKPPPAARKEPTGDNSPLRTNVSDPGRAKKGQDRSENFDSLKGSAAATKKRVAELEAALENMKKEANHKIDKQKAQLIRKQQALTDLQEENQQLVEDVEHIQNYMGKPRPTFDKTTREYQATVKQVKGTVKDSFGEFKLVNTDRHADQYAEYIMDNVGLPYLLHEDDENAVRTAEVIKDRGVFRAEFEKVWLSALNGQRSDAQVKSRMSEFQTICTVF